MKELSGGTRSPLGSGVWHTPCLTRTPGPASHGLVFAHDASPTPHTQNPRPYALQEDPRPQHRCDRKFKAAKCSRMYKIYIIIINTIIINIIIYLFKM
jgi:hypothetical protein